MNRIVEVIETMSKEVKKMPGYEGAAGILQTIAMNMENVSDPFHALVQVSREFSELELGGKDWGMVRSIIDTLLANVAKQMLGSEAKDMDMADMARVLDVELQFARESEQAAGDMADMQPVMLALRNSSPETEAEATRIVDAIFKKPRDASDDIADRIFKSPSSPRKAALQHA